MELKKWIITIATMHNKRCGDLNFMLCSDDYMLSANVKFLGHDYFTDILTFDNSNDLEIAGDILISIDTVRSNALKFNTSFLDELHRVIIHGVLHLIGFTDKTKKQQIIMRQEEDKALNMRIFV
jgi:probable rRNA maturation factor